MKRTVEIVLGVIGVVLSGIMSLFGFTLISAANSEEINTLLFEEFNNDPMFTIEDVEMIIGALPVMGWILVAAAVSGVVFGLIGVFSVRGNRKPKLAGAMFIIGAVLVGILTIGFGFIPALLLLIAGIMCFARKPKVQPDELSSNNYV